jgi:hypothetical protein
MASKRHQPQPSSSNLQQICGFISLCAYVHQHGRIGARRTCFCPDSGAHPATGTRLPQNSRNAGLRLCKRKLESPCEYMGALLKPLSRNASLENCLPSSRGESHSTNAVSSIASLRAEIFRTVRSFIANTALDADQVYLYLSDSVQTLLKPSYERPSNCFGTDLGTLSSQMTQTLSILLVISSM